MMLTVLGDLPSSSASLSASAPEKPRAKADGKSLGRKPKLTPHQNQEAIRRRDDGQSVREIARSYTVSHSTISRLVS